jgi:putative transposase
VKRPTFTRADRILLVLLAKLVRAWQQTLLIVQPDTLLRWHRELFRLYWKRKSKTRTHKPKVAAETIALIREMAKDNRLWGAERIHGELLKLGLRVCKRTVQKYMRTVRTQKPRGQTWVTFLRTHAGQIWACDFLQVSDLFFRPLFAFFVVELKSRKVIHVGVTRSPTDAWAAQQLREATPYGQAPKYLICDHDSKYGSCFHRVATTSGIKLLKTPVHAPQANAVCERFLRSVRQECLDHPVDLAGEAAPARSECVCGLLQPGTAASRDPATDPRTAPIDFLRSGCRQQGDRSSGHGWAAPRLPPGSLKRDHVCERPTGGPGPSSWERRV